MDKRFTDEEVVEAALCCTANACETCPFIVLGAGFKKCVIKFSEYIANNTKNEPAPAATGTSSEVSVKEDTDNIQFNGSTKEQICQEAEKAYKACELILEIYERMDDSEQKAFELGHSYQVMSEVQEELARIGKGGEGNG